MGGQAQGQQGSQGSQVYYDPEMGQYYTQTPQNKSPFAGMLGNQVPSGMFASQPTGNDLFSNAFYSMFAPSGQRTYLNNFNQRQQIEQAPYQYADVSLESLFPSMYQNNDNSALTGLLNGLPSSAIGSASSGAGRFLSSNDSSKSTSK
jgi:hypothetical protein